MTIPKGDTNTSKKEKSIIPKKKVLSKEVETIFMERDDEYEYEETIGGFLPKGDN